MAKKAVVVDDDRKVLMLLEKALLGFGIQVLTAENGTKALELIKKEKPDLVVTDILIPGLDGIQLCNSIQEDPNLNSKVIMITGVYNEASYRLEMDCKADAFIEKPIDIGKLKTVITQHLPLLDA